MILDHGSFTGIRIGIATVKAFHDSKNIPVVGISSLECLAKQASNNMSKNTLICSMIDCKNDNCYFALYQKTDDILDVLIEPQAESVTAALSIIDNYIEDSRETSNIYFVGDATINFKEEIKNKIPYSYFSNEKLNLLNSYFLGLCGLEFYNSNIEPTPDRQINDILPLYLKKPQAQRQLEEKEDIIPF